MEKLSEKKHFSSQENDDIFNIFDQIKVSSWFRYKSGIVIFHGGSFEITLTVPLHFFVTFVVVDFSGAVGSSEWINAVTSEELFGLIVRSVSNFSFFTSLPFFVFTI